MNKKELRLNETADRENASNEAMRVAKSHKRSTRGGGTNAGDPQKNNRVGRKDKTND